MPIEVKLHNNSSLVKSKTGHCANDARLEALIKELQKTKQDLGYIILDDLVIPAQVYGNIPQNMLNLLINYFIDKVSYRDEVYKLNLSDDTTLGYYCSNPEIYLNYVEINKESGFFQIDHIAINHASLSNLDYLSSGHIGFAGIEFGTTEEWNAQSVYVPPVGMIVVYTDYSQDEETGENIPGIKIGNGHTYLVNIPFIGDDVEQALEEHVANMTMHITEEERERWNNKLNYDAPEGDLLTFTRD